MIGGHADGGAGGSGSTAGAVYVYSKTDIQTTGDDSAGMVAQSIGGGGGNGGFSVAGDISSGSKAYALSLGGAGGSGNTGAAVTLAMLHMLGEPEIECGIGVGGGD